MLGRINVAVIFGFTLSGASGLIYQVLWQRKLALMFGATLPAITAVLSAFMGGLALGSFIFGRIADRSKHPVRLCGILELGVAIYCFFMPVTFKIIETLHLTWYATFGDSFLIQVIRFVLSMSVLVIPCAFMGGTLPILSRALIQSRSELGTKISILYFINTIGAAVGTLFAGFVGIRFWGIIVTNNIAVSMNLITACLFLLISFTMFMGTPIPPKRSVSNRGNWLPFIYGMLGFLAMACEVAWTRSLNLVIGSTVYAFAMMLTAFLLGIALGSLAAGKWIDRMPSPLTAVGFLVVLTGLLIATSIAIISRLPVIMLMLFPKFHSNFVLWQMCLFLLGLLVVFPATFSMGATFPAISKAYIQTMQSIGRQVGTLYLWNTMGGIFGSIAAGFFLIPYLGTRSSLVSIAILFALIGLGILWFRNEANFPRSRIVALAILCIVLTALLPDWNPILLDSGVYLYAPQLVHGFEKNRKIVYEHEGFHSYVTVSDLGQVRSLRINGKTDGSDGGDLTTQVLLAQLPLLHAPKASDVLIIGLGTGVTLGSALTHPDLKAACVEIDESVIAASAYFNHVSGEPLKSPRARLVAADARTVLAGSTKTYDVIISEPSNPWITGVSNLFTYEHFQACSGALKPDGIMCQWIHSYYMETDTLAILFRTFARVFPECSLWESSPGDYLILGSIRPIVSSDSEIASFFECSTVRKDLERIEIKNPEDLLIRRVLETTEFQRLVNDSGTDINRDDKPIVEFNAPRSLYRDTVNTNKQFIESYRTQKRH
jgi:spermidine synthase